MARSKQRATYDDLLKLPDNLIGEIIDAGKISPFEAVRAIDAAYREETSAELKDMLAYVLLHVRARALTGRVSP